MLLASCAAKISAGKPRCQLTAKKTFSDIDSKRFLKSCTSRLIKIGKSPLDSSGGPTKLVRECILAIYLSNFSQAGLPQVLSYGKVFKIAYHQI